MNFVIIDHACGLHVAVDDGWADEIEAALFHVPGNGFRQPGFRRQVFHAFPAVVDGVAIDETPDIFAEGTEFFSHGDEGI